MTEFYRAVVTLRGASGDPRDVFVNSFCIQGPDVWGGGDMAAVGELFRAFYDDNVSVPLGSISGSLGPHIAETGHTVTVYELETAGPHLPVDDPFEWDFAAAPAGDPLPGEVAVCLSMRGAVVAGTNVGPGPHLPARHRGRVYIGPLNTAAGALDGSDLRVPLAMRQRVTGAAEILAAGLAAYDSATALVGEFQLGVWSPTRGAGDVVEQVWVDNAFDIQRRRGGAPTARTTVTL